MFLRALKSAWNRWVQQTNKKYIMFLTYTMLYLSGSDPASALALLIGVLIHCIFYWTIWRQWQGLVCGPHKSLLLGVNPEQTSLRYPSSSLGNLSFCFPSQCIYFVYFWFSLILPLQSYLIMTTVNSALPACWWGPALLCGHCALTHLRPLKCFRDNKVWIKVWSFCGRVELTVV